MTTKIRFTFTDRDRLLAGKMLHEQELPWGGLPYTSEFEAMRAEFNALTGQQFDQLKFWRLLVRASADGLAQRRKRKPLS